MNAVVRADRFEPAARPQWTLVCRLDDILPGSGVAALVQGKPVAVFRLAGDRVYVIGNVDPFSGASVLSRGIVGDIGGDPVVASPVYKQHFRLADGRCREDESVGVASYRVAVVDGGVIVQSPAKQ